MSKIDKNANLYDKDGNLLRKAPLTNVTIEELEKMIDEYKGDKSSKEYTNLIYSLMDLYNKYGNPHEQELIERIKQQAASNSDDDERRIRESLEELADEIDKSETDKSNEVPSYNVDSNEDEYVEIIEEK